MENELAHHGILGMKWGVRRTPEQLARSRGKTDSQIESERRKKEDLKNRGALSDADLKKRVERLQMEKQLRELTEQELYPGRVAAKKVLAQIGTRVATTALTGAALYGIKAAVGGHFDAKEMANAIFNGGAKKK